MWVQQIGLPGGEENLIVVRQLKDEDEQHIGDIASRAFPRLGLARLAIDKSLPVDAVREAYRREGEGYAKRVLNSEKNMEILVAEEKDCVAGYVVLGVNDEWSDVFGFKWASIVSLAVDPDFWGKGIGSRLIERGLRRLKEQGARYVEVFTDQNNMAAIRAYEKNGFRIVHSGITLSQYLED